MKSLYFLLFLFLVPAAMALNIDLSINDVFSVDVLYFDYNETNDKFSLELLNEGSLPFLAQARIDVVEGNETRFTTWSRSHTLMPGNTKFMEFAWPAPEGEYKAKLRIYYSGEMLEEEIDISVLNQEREDVFEISSIRIFDKFIRLGVTSSQDMEQLFLVPADYPQGWVITQGMLEDVRENVPQEIVLTYEPTFYSPRPITFYIISDDGRYSSSHEVNLVREQGISAFFHNLAYSFFAEN